MKQTLLFLFTAVFSLTANAQNTYVPDDNFEQALIDLGYDSGPLDDYVPTANINAITVLNIPSKSIADLTGIADFIALTWLNCFNNSLTSLDLSSNVDLVTVICKVNQLTSLTANTTLLTLNANENNFSTIDLSNFTSLQTLYINHNSLSSLDVSSNVELKNLECYNTTLTELTLTNNTALETLKCNNNAITNLDLSLNPNLTSINAGANELSSLNVKNGMNANISSANFSALQNPNLTCIQVDDLDWSTTNWTSIDTTTTFSENCNATTYVPDDNFEQALIDLGYDSGALDDYVPTINISSVTGLNVNNKNISDLTGIGDFISLTELVCYQNTLTSLDVSENVGLTTLNCQYNALTSLDVSANTALTDLICNNNALTVLDVSLNTSLMRFFCNDNALTGLDVSENTALTDLYCDNNALTSLDTSSNTALIRLYCYENSLTSLDVTSNTVLTNLSCHSNAISSLNVDNNTLMTVLYCSNNLLTSLNLSNNINLNNVQCQDNSLTVLNIANGNNTSFPNYYFITLNNPNLTCIQVDDAIWSTTNWTNIDATATFSEDCASLSVDDYELNTISLYPNPVTTILSLQLEESIEKVEVFTMQGQKVLENKTNKIDVSNLSNGIYLLKVYATTGKIGVRRFVKM